MKLKKKKFVYILLIAAVLIGGAIFALLYNGIIWFNNPSLTEYPVRGIDISSYQGKIDWTILSVQNIDFAFIKATEGSTYQDPSFQTNWQEANQTVLKIGAYHFFSYDSSGKTQAENFIRTVPVLKSSLPPVVDIEFYGDKEKNPPAKEDVLPELNELLKELENQYGKKPIIYATMKSYRMYLEEDYKDYPLWIRNVIAKPNLSDKREWLFWQYSHRQKLDGYNGKEKYIDMNVFNGTKEDFLALTKS